MRFAALVLYDTAHAFGLHAAFFSYVGVITNMACWDWNRVFHLGWERRFIFGIMHIQRRCLDDAFFHSADSSASAPCGIGNELLHMLSTVDAA